MTQNQMEILEQWRKHNDEHSVIHKAFRKLEDLHDESNRIYVLLWNKITENGIPTNFGLGDYESKDEDVDQKAELLHLELQLEAWIEFRKYKVKEMSNHIIEFKQKINDIKTKLNKT